MRAITPFSIRLAPSTRANLEAIQREQSARTGEKITLAQIVERLLDGPAPREDFQTEIEEFRSDPQATIIQINQKLSSGMPYRRSEWVYIAEQILEDTDTIPPQQAIFDRTLWSAVFDALFAIACLLADDSPVLRYIASKALDGATGDGRAFNSVVVQKALADKRAVFLAQANPIKSSYVARALLVAIRDGGRATDDTFNIPDNQIENALSGSKKDLTKLAIRAIVDRLQKPFLDPYFTGSQEAFNYQAEYVSLSAFVERSGDLSCGLILGKVGLYVMLSLDGLGQISDLHDCLSGGGLSRVRKSKRFEVRTPHVEGGDTYLITDKGATIRLGEVCLNQLLTGLATLLSFGVWDAQLAQLRHAYGR